jgi:hypothetical protein
MARDPMAKVWGTARKGSPRKSAATKKLEPAEKRDRWGRKLGKDGKMRPHPKNWGLRKPLYKDGKLIGYGPPAGPKRRR